MPQLSSIPVKTIQEILASSANPILKTQILSDIFRFNTLYMIKKAGSGHIGTSFSFMEILTWLWTQEMTAPNEKNRDHADVCFSSKGHDAPGLYALLIGLGKLPEEKLHQLRRLGGLPGHPDINTPYMVTNTGSLGMGISKARGMAKANRLSGKKGQFYVITGDGELQEGQFWESLQPTANQGYSEITVIIDHNKIQSDTWVKNVSDLGDLEAKLKSYGWEVARCDGHDVGALQKVFQHFKTIPNRPQILIADTIKGKGVGIMESSRLGESDLYGFHSGAPSDEAYQTGVTELLTRINSLLASAQLPPIQPMVSDHTPANPPNNPEKLVTAYGEELLRLGQSEKEMVVLDADLMLDCGLIPFKDAYPDRFIECGIAEQDMVSMAGGLALSGKLPIVHSFACFLSTRPNEQIYNNATEHTKIVYAGSLAGINPAPPGHSHQCVRDISGLGSIPGLTLIQPANAQETQLALRWAVQENPESSYLRLVSVPVEIPYTLPEGYSLQKGQGVSITPHITQADAVLFAYGPIMLTQAYQASQILKESGIALQVINLPWLNVIDSDWLTQTLQGISTVFTLDDHYVQLGQGTQIAATIASIETLNPKVVSLGLTEVPRSGQNAEVLAHHQLDASSLAQQIQSQLGEKALLSLA